MRHVPPAYSPLGFGEVVAGAAALLGVDWQDPAAAIRADLGGREVLLLDSGTTALTLAIRGALRKRPGAAVALPAFCCYDVATAAAGADAPVVLYDVDPATLGPDATSLRRALAEDVGAAVVAHLFGVPVDVPAVAAEVRAAGAIVIEDAAQGAGGRLGERPLGALGSVSVLSFGRGKGVTGGSGGALVAHDDAGVAIVAAGGEGLRSGAAGAVDWVKLAAQWVLGRPGLYAIPASVPMLRLGETVYRAPRPAARMSRVAARVVANTWPGREAEAEGRRRVAARLLRGAPQAFVVPAPPAGALPGYLRLPVVAPEAARAAAATPRARRMGIMPPYPQVLADLPGFARRCRNPSDSLPGARTLAARLITLPAHRLLTASDLDRLEAWLHRHAV